MGKKGKNRNTRYSPDYQASATESRNMRQLHTETAYGMRQLHTETAYGMSQLHTETANRITDAATVADYLLAANALIMALSNLYRLCIYGNGWVRNTTLFSDMFLIGSDYVILLKEPKSISLTIYIFITLVIWIIYVINGPESLLICAGVVVIKLWWLRIMESSNTVIKRLLDWYTGECVEECVEHEYADLKRQVCTFKKTFESTKGPEPMECCVCRDKKPDVLLLPCKHLVVCKKCVKGINRTCPICREMIEQEINVFFA